MSFEWRHVVLYVLPMLPTFWSIQHIWNHAFASYQTKMLWLALVVFVPVLGGLIYIFTGRKKAMPEY